MRTVDLRSDTVTRPTPAMRQAMYQADVGDDVFGEDPTVNLLERRAAELVGKEAALFVPSGTMGNQIAVAVHTSPGHEVICDEHSHVVLYEMGTLARFSGCLARAAPTSDGILDYLFAHIEKPEFVYEHEWTVGELIMWDNRCSAHARTWFSPDKRRMMRRVTVRDPYPVV